jgi:lipoic acid synthetase
MNEKEHKAIPFELKVLDWGLLPYGEALQRQRLYAEKRIADKIPDHLMLVEHPPVVTIGRSGSAEDLRRSEEEIRREGIELFHVDRGGMATFHGPGQLVAYPIIKLKTRDLHLYLKTLLEVAASVLKNYGLKPEFREGHPGIWVNSSKIASIGIAVRKWVTCHGIALNVNTDLSQFDMIVPCGHPEERITSMKRELGSTVDITAVKRRFTEQFCRHFGYSMPREMLNQQRKHPPWLVRSAPGTKAIDRMENKLNGLRLHTVCQSARCPNLGECFNRGSATFMILGETCSRNCRFCAVEKGVPSKVDPDEPGRVAVAAEELGLKYVVITSVTRDDLPDGGAEQFAFTINAVRKRLTTACIEVLIPDFNGDEDALQTVCRAKPDMLNHNIETVPRLYPKIRPRAKYPRSLKILKFAVSSGLPAKSGLMLGLGETEKEIKATLKDVVNTGCRYLTLGQYLAPSRDHAPVMRYILPEEFDKWADVARRMGFIEVASGPLVRSSFRADEMYYAVRPVISNQYAVTSQCR